MSMRVRRRPSLKCSRKNSRTELNKKKNKKNWRSKWKLFDETPATAEFRGRSWRFVEVTWETAIYEWKLKWFLHLMVLINRIHNFPGIRVDFLVNLASFPHQNKRNCRAQRSQPQFVLILTNFSFSNLFFKFGSSCCSCHRHMTDRFNSSHQNLHHSLAKKSWVKI